MSELRGLVTGQLDRLLLAGAGVAVLRAVESGTWPAALWAAAEEQGLALALVPEAAGGAGLGWSDAAAMWVVLGRHGAPLPLGEAMLAARFAAEAGLELPSGFAAPALGDAPVPFGRHACAVLRLDGARLSLHPALLAAPGANLGREPRDRMRFGAPSGEGSLPNGSGARAGLLALALLRAALIAGAGGKALALAVDWANTRRQFGRPIGRFQAVQQLLAAVAGEVAAAEVAVAGAARATDRRGLDGAAFEIAAAKVVAGEAATAVAAAVHQVFAAIGITEEHELHHLTRRLWSWREEGGTERSWATELGRAAMARGGSNLWADLTARDTDGAAA